MSVIQVIKAAEDFKITKQEVVEIKETIKVTTIEGVSLSLLTMLFNFTMRKI